MCGIRDVLVLGVLFTSLQRAECTESQCVSSSLPQSERELRSLVQGSPPPQLTHQYEQLRLFPNVTFNCSGSIVGWSMIAPSKDRMKGGFPVISVWTPSTDGETFQQGPLNSRLIPCLKEVISEDQELYLYENVTERPVEFQQGDILGMLLRREAISYLCPYFMTRPSFVALNRTRRRAVQIVSRSDFGSDEMMPLLFLHICSRDNVDYDGCVQNSNRLPTRCVDTSESPSPSPSFNPSPTNQNGDSISLAVVATAVVVPLSLTLLIVTVVVVLVLLYMGLVRRRRSSKTGGDIERSDGATVTPNTNVNGEAEPYAEPIVRPSPRPSLQPSPRSRTPLPPPPTQPPPPPGLSVQPTYAVLSGPTPSPPPPYSMELELSKQPNKQNGLPSPEYDSIDQQNRKAALVRQNATQTSVDSTGYAKVEEREDNM